MIFNKIKFTTIIFALVLIFSSINAERAYSQAVWNNRVYYGRVCNSPTCRMCASIQQQLRATKSFTLPSQALNPSPKAFTLPPQAISPSPKAFTLPPQAISPSPKAFILPPQAPTPIQVVDVMLSELKLDSGDIFYDLGCGDGRFVINASKRYSCTSIGIEINNHIAQRTRQLVKNKSLNNLVKIVNEDARSYELYGATAISMYLYSDLMEELIPNIPYNTKIVSYQHKIPGVKSHKRIVTFNGESHVYYFGVK